MQFHAIHIQGNILSAELLEQIRSDQKTLGQAPKDFWLEPGAKLRDEIHRAWADVKDQYQIFNRRLEKLKEGDSGRAETRKYWMLDFFDYLGYKLEAAPADISVNGKPYRISHQAANLGGLPVHIAGIRESLDKKPGGRGSMSPHALVQEYLNLTEHVYGLVANGAQLRLLRDSSRLTRLSYLEFDLTKILEEDRYADFALLYRLLHASRMPRTAADSPAALIERYHTDSLEAGSRIREKLAGSVEQAILTFANGFLKHPENEALHAALAGDGRPHDGRPQGAPLRADGLYDELLRLIYRLLFLMVTEERNLIYPEAEAGQAPDPGETRRRQIYYQYYAVNRLRLLAEKRLYDQQRYSDLWDGLLHSFRLFQAGDQGKALGIAPLAGDLFSPKALAHLGQCRLDNESLLRAVFLLSAFENEQKQIIRVNYAGLDVEEFGSVYEGLLEYQPAVQAQPWEFRFEKGTERSSSGAHYTPDELVHPLIKHSLDYLIADRLKQDPSGESLLTLKVADVACGSGHILLAAARRIALELARARTQEDQPAPAPYRRALREVVQHCIYGVDKNPLAVELCKVALWLEAHNPGQPLNFLDHRIKCGDAIVGLAHKSELENGIADAAFKTLAGADKAIAKTFRDKNARERKERAAKALQLKAEFEKSADQSAQEALAEYRAFNQLPETSPEEIERKAKAYRRFLDGKGFSFLKALADTQAAQFFIPKTEANKDYLMTDADYRLTLGGYKGWQSPKVAKAAAVAFERRFFHWFLEFPEVFAAGKHPGRSEGSGAGGFDCVVGNPPFLGGQKLSGTFGDNYLEYIKDAYQPIGAVDLVTYFFRRIFGIIRPGGFQSLISTNTIAQGRAREDGLDVLVQQGGAINHAVRSMKWPGAAAVEVALVTVTRQTWKGPFVLSGKEVKTITPYLDDAVTLGNPYALKQNAGKSFQGSIVLGKGFVLESEQAQALIAQNPKNKDVLFPYLNGDDLNNSPEQSPSRWVINFFDWPEEKARGYPDCYKIIEQLVKPERQRWATDSSGNEIVGKYALRKPLPEKWWIYGEKRPALYRTIAPLERVLVVAQVSKTLGFVFVPRDQVISMMCIALTFDKEVYLVLLQNSLHKEWVHKYASALKSDIRYTPSDVFETFPFPQNLNPAQEQNLEQIGETYHEHRRQLMLGMWLGLTKTYNLFHTKELPAPEEAAEVAALPPKAIEKQYGKEVAKLVRHLAESAAATYTLEQALAGIHRLRTLHVEMDQAVLAAYGWSDIALRHDFYEVDYLPEHDRVRFTIHPEARKEVLRRLLELNHAVYAEEVARGLHGKGKGNKKKVSAEAEAGEDDGYLGKQGKLF